MISSPAASSESDEPSRKHAALIKASTRSWGPCPSWIEKYGAWHQEKLNNAPLMDARYILFSCDAQGALYCSGIGDRLRGMLESVRIAQASDRVILFDWSLPGQIAEVLLPSKSIDWRIQQQYKLDDPGNIAFRWSTWIPHSSKSSTPMEISNGSLKSSPARVVVLSHNIRDSSGKKFPGPGLGSLGSADRACLFQALFKPSELLATKTRSIRQLLIGSEVKPYLAIHLRLGGFEGEAGIKEKSICRGQDRFLSLLSVFSCARELAAARKIDPPFVILTDNSLLRRQLQQGFYHDFIAPPGIASHSGSQNGTGGRDALISSFVDLSIMAEASCFIGSPSGFSWTSLNWGRHECFLSVKQCVEMYSN